VTTLQEIYGIGERVEHRLHGILTVAQLWNATPFQLRRVWGGINGVLFHQMLHGVDIQPPSSRFSKSIGHQHVLEPDLRTNKGARFCAALTDQGGRTAAARRLLLPTARRASVVGRRSRRLVGRNRFL
jgi:nucleotidyltransferase/DNA polymerase involved in DNA repair